ncbi:metal ABC transporter permease [Thalassoroseus pseudoceratinae]|uniref:metal ABC transporter permease n=1 Tax=Thalassoroseus pseudoceratinae TaxID=2713176 RepID=UPI00141FCEB8|nr:metal ABC transporter permease [Thalassoroseus pseudoceratinae]
MGLTSWDWFLDGWIILTGILSAVSAALLGNFLVLRRMCMLGDAISHAILPGLAGAFFLSGSRNSGVMFIGAVLVGVLTAFFTEWIRKSGRVDEGASMGVVFTSLFAIGLIMIVQAADQVDLDAHCVLYGALELTPLDTVQIFNLDVPRAALILGFIALVDTLFVTLFYKELKLSSFDPSLATTAGFSASLMHYLLMTLVAVTAVASFESVGNILVVAMFVVPPATAYLLTDRLQIMIFLSVILAIASASFGHLLAIIVPAWFGYASTTTAGMMATTSGLFLGLAVLFAPRHGVLVKVFRHQLLSFQILADDIVGVLYRLHEKEPCEWVHRDDLVNMLFAKNLQLQVALKWLSIRQQIKVNDQEYRLTPAGETRARELVRSHRLWEQYLVSHAGLEHEKIHDKAEQFEHFTSRQLRAQLDEATGLPDVDPHGRPIPIEDQNQETHD